MISNYEKVNSVKDQLQDKSPNDNFQSNSSTETIVVDKQLIRSTSSILFEPRNNRQPEFVNNSAISSNFCGAKNEVITTRNTPRVDLRSHLISPASSVYKEINSQTFEQNSVKSIDTDSVGQRNSYLVNIDEHDIQFELKSIESKQFDSTSEASTPDMMEECATLEYSDDEFECWQRSTIGGNFSSHNSTPLEPCIASLFSNTPSTLRFVYDGETGSSDWIGSFGNHLKNEAFRPIKEFQKVNHFPGTFQLGRKDKLWMNLSQLRKLFGRSVVDFVPRTYCLPSDLDRLKTAWKRSGGKISPAEPNSGVGGDDAGIGAAAVPPLWILKPPAAARGCGVRVVRKWTDIPKQRKAIVQTYISRPFLIDDTKFDLRIYVGVTSFNPLRAYIHHNGLVRFASEKYTSATSNLCNRFVHLTNYSINKNNPNMLTHERAAKAQKWKLEQLWAYLARRRYRVDLLWDQIKEIVFKTLTSSTAYVTSMAELHCKRSASSFELFGFDILLDEDLKPWLLEVNVSPSLHTSTALDNDVKSVLITDLFNIVGFQLPPERRAVFSRMHTANRLANHRRSNASSQLSGDSPSFEPIETGLTRDFKTHERYATSDNLSSRNTMPISDPTLWDTALAHDERRKHEFYQQGKNAPFCDEVLPKCMNTILSYLTPDDVRNLICLVDELYRVKLGSGFQPIFPLPDVEGLQRLEFLLLCSTDKRCRQLTSRLSQTRYYDQLNWAFLTYYARRYQRESGPALVNYGDYDDGDTLVTADSMSKLCEMLQLQKRGLDRLNEFCKKGYHQAWSSTSESRLPWTPKASNMTDAYDWTVVDEVVARYSSSRPPMTATTCSRLEDDARSNNASDCRARKKIKVGKTRQDKSGHQRSGGRNSKNHPIWDSNQNHSGEASWLNRIEAVRIVQATRKDNDDDGMMECVQSTVSPNPMDGDAIEELGRPFVGSRKSCSDWSSTIQLSMITNCLIVKPLEKQLSAIDIQCPSTISKSTQENGSEDATRVQK